jgi:glycine/D-amino acid oxidase-like deaminating enzyme
MAPATTSLPQSGTKLKVPHPIAEPSPLNVVVIGAGIIGCSVAYHLAKAGCSVKVVDSKGVAGGATRASFAWLNSNAKQPRNYHDLNVAGMQEHKRFARRSRPAPWFHPSGNFEWSATEEAGAELEAKVNRLRDWRYPAGWVTVEELERREPDVSVLRSRTMKVAHYPEEAWVDTRRLAFVLLRRSMRKGATIHACREVVWMDAAGDDRIARVVTNTHERFDADFIIVCAGPATEGVVSLAGGRLPLKNRAGLVALSAPVAIGLKSILHAPNVSIRPDEGGRVLMYSRALDVPKGGTVSGLDPLHAGGRVLAAAADVVPALRDSRIERTRFGVRPIPQDGLPVVGLLPGLQNLYVAVTHSGVTLALILGRLIALEVAFRRPQRALVPFRPERFAI